MSLDIARNPDTVVRDATSRQPVLPRCCMNRFPISLLEYIYFLSISNLVFQLLVTARQKLNVLNQAVSKMNVTAEVKANANMFYHNILARSMCDNYKDEAVAEGGLIEFEMEDPNVPSHAIVKLRSKQLVDAQVSEFDVPDMPTKK
ncbi:hypothetical protein ACJJTC_000787 [Scirpophaga incertulas]